MSLPTGGNYGTMQIVGISGGRKVVAAGGTREQVTANETHITAVIVQALRSNSGNVMVGGSDVDVTVGSENGIELSAGQSETLWITDLSLLYIDADNTGEGISYSILRG
jgi:hypothetical protein